MHAGGLTFATWVQQRRKAMAGGKAVRQVPQSAAAPCAPPACALVAA